MAGRRPAAATAAHAVAALLTDCGPFADHRPDPHSVVMTRALQSARPMVTVRGSRVVQGRVAREEPARDEPEAENHAVSRISTWSPARITPSESGIMFWPKTSCCPNRRRRPSILSGCEPTSPVIWSVVVTTHRPQGLTTRNCRNRHCPSRSRGAHRCCRSRWRGVRRYRSFSDSFRGAGEHVAQRLLVQLAHLGDGQLGENLEPFRPFEPGHPPPPTMPLHGPADAFVRGIVLDAHR